MQKPSKQHRFDCLASKLHSSRVTHLNWPVTNCYYVEQLRALLHKRPPLHTRVDPYPDRWRNLTQSEHFVKTHPEATGNCYINSPTYYLKCITFQRKFTTIQLKITTMKYKQQVGVVCGYCGRGLAAKVCKTCLLRSRFWPLLVISTKRRLFCKNTVYRKINDSLATVCRDWLVCQY